MVEKGYVTEADLIQNVRKVAGLMVLKGEIVKVSSGDVEPSNGQQLLVYKIVQPTPAAVPVPVPVVAPVPALPLDMLDPKLLVEVNKLVSKVGGADRLRTYVTTLEELQVLTQGGTKVS